MNNEQTKLPGDTPIITVEDLRSKGIEDVAKAQVALKYAISKGLAVESIANIAEDLTVAANALTKATQELTESKRVDAESAKFDELNGDAQVAKFIEATKTNPKLKVELAATLNKDYGVNNVNLVLEGNKFKSVLMRPLSKSHAKYDDISEVQKAHDYALIYCAAIGATTEQKGSGDILFDPSSYSTVIDRLANEGMVGATVIKASIMDSVDAGLGLEFIPSYTSSQLLYDFYLQFRVMALFKRIPQPTSIYKLPMQKSRGRAYNVAQATASANFFQSLITSSIGATDQVILTAQKMGAVEYFSDEFAQDSIIPVIEIIRERIIWAMGEGFEDVGINGSTSLLDLDNAGTDTNRLYNNTVDAGDGIRLATGAADVRTLFDGLRKMTNAGAKVDFGGSMAAATLLGKIRALRRTMGKYGIDPTKVNLAVAIGTAIDILAMPEVMTMEKFGPLATVKVGEIGKLDGSSIIVSEQQRGYYNALGVFDNVTKTSTLMHYIHEDACIIGDRQEMNVFSGQNPLGGISYIAANARLSFKKRWPATENVIAQGINIPA